MTAVKLIIYVPQTHADKVRKALGDAGAGKIGEYAFCSFSTKGIGRFMPLENANPAIGTRGKLQEVEEERIETICEQSNLEKILTAVKEVHPYESIAYDIYPLLNDFTAEKYYK